MRVLEAKYCARISLVERADWNMCFPGEAEAHEYYSACELGESSSRMGAICVSRGRQIVAVAPVFSMRFSPEASFQSDDGAMPGLLRTVARWIQLPVICIGSPLAERCHIGWHPELNAMERRAALEALIDAVESQARSTGVGLVAAKDILDDADDEICAVLAERGFVRLPGLPIATLDLSGVRDIEGYLATLSPSTRRDLRRKLRSAPAVRMEDRHDIADVDGELTMLYESVREASRFDYGELEKLPARYFAEVSRQLGERALFRLYWVGDTLAAFNLLLLERDRVIDKFLGMRYPLARDYNLYALSWIENVRLCLARGARTLQTGQTAYREKIRLGSRLASASIWFRHRRMLTHQLLRAVAPLASFEHSDPDLSQVAAEAAP